jgi:hypothetical protein
LQAKPANETVEQEFNERLEKKIGKFIGLGFNWSNVLIAGGLISGLLEKKMDPTEYILSDIDMFVYGKTKEIVTNKIQEIYDYFINKLNKKCYVFVYIPNTPIINIIVPGKCSIQVVGTLFKNEMDVLKSFDLTHCQVGFNGIKIVHSNEFVTTVQSRITKITGRSIHAYRLVKTYNRGYSITRPKYCYVRNIFHEYTNKIDSETGPLNLIPSNTDKYYDINKLQEIIDELSENKIVIQNLTKNFIPPVDNNRTSEENQLIMKKIGDLYAGEGKYYFLNDCSNGLYVKDIKEFLVFTRMPFLC